MPVIHINLRNPVFPSGDTVRELRRDPVYCVTCCNLYAGTVLASLPRRELRPYDDGGQWNAELAAAAGTLTPAPAWAGPYRFDYAPWDMDVYLPDMHRSAQAGCESCAFVEAVFAHFGHGLGAGSADGAGIGLTLSCCPGMALRVAVRKAAVPGDSDSDSDSDWGLFPVVGPLMDHLGGYLARFELYTIGENPSPWSTIGPSMTLVPSSMSTPPIKGGKARHVVPDPNTESCFALIKNWLRDCTDSHHLCRQADSHATRQLPKRTIYVGPRDNQSIRLFERSELLSGGREPRYAALSHCWGQSRHLTLERGTLARRKAHIEWDSLPRTFQDAILVARGIGIDHIWIDSLCIIQDDALDWETEAAKMASIYDGAYLVIAATASVDGDGGCLFSRSDFLQVRGKSHDGVPFNVFARRQCSHSMFNWYVEHGSFDTQPDGVTGANYPLFGRGWCFQERVLATRMLHFTRDEMVFECLSGVDCECGVMDDFADDPLLFSRRLVKLGSEDEKLQAGDVWRDLVTQYSEKRLTKHTDALPAFAGLANRWSHNMKTGSYLAGHWTHDLPGGLLWRLNESDPKPFEAAPGPHYIAPSWSWASAQRAVTWAQLDFGKMRYFVTVDLERSGCRRSGVDPFGRVQSGWIFVTGRLMTVTCKSVGEGQSFLIKNGKSAYFWPDNLLQSQGLVGQDVVCLRCSDWYPMVENDCALVLVPAAVGDRSGTPESVQTWPRVFRRVGFTRNYAAFAWGHDRDSEKASIYLI